MLSEMVDYQRRPISVDEFDRMYDARILLDERLELIDGDIVVPPPMGPPHAGGIVRLDGLLQSRLFGRATVRCQCPLPLLPRSEPLPDFVIARYDRDCYSKRHPKPEEVLWLIEVGHKTRRYDRETKLPLYARYRIPEVWLLDLVERKLSVAREPNDVGYSRIVTLGEGDVVQLTAFPDVSFAVADLLGLA